MPCRYLVLCVIDMGELSADLLWRLAAALTLMTAEVRYVGWLLWCCEFARPREDVVC